MDRLLSCCLLTLDSRRTRFTELYICTRVLFIFSIVTENVTLCVCVCVSVCTCVYACAVLGVWVFQFDLGMFCTKKANPRAAVRGKAELSYEIRCILWGLGKIFFVFFFM